MSNTIQKTVNRKVGKNYLTGHEVTLLLNAAGKTRNPERDQALILLSYRHGLRAVEAVSLEWNQIDLKAATIYVSRAKGSDPSNQRLEADEVRLLKKVQQKNPDNAFVFVSEKGTAMTTDNFLKLIKRLGKECGLPSAHPHMLRHGAGFALANQGVSTRTIQAFLGHKNIQHTTIYTKIADKTLMGLGKKIGGKL